ncbi:NAD(P)-dependent oxidoreductase [soil metagenome]
MRRQALITGATGFVGSHLIERLIGRGWLVRALVRATSDTRLLKELGVELAVGDLGDAASVERAALGCDTVFHLAAATFERDEASFARANEAGTRVVAERSVASGVRRLVYLSSYAACGPSIPGQPRRQEQMPGPLTAYGRTKLAGEQAVIEAGAAGLETVIVRAPAVYGPRDHALLSYFKLVRWWLAPSPGGGERYLHLIYGPDLAIALERAADSAVGIHAVADPQVHAWSDLVDEISRSLGRRPVKLKLPVSFVRVAARLTERVGGLAGRTVTFNREKAEEMLAASWVCELSGSEVLLPPGEVTPLREGIAETVRWYSRQGWL